MGLHHSGRGERPRRINSGGCIAQERIYLRRETSGVLVEVNSCVLHPRIVSECGGEFLSEEMLVFTFRIYIPPLLRALVAEVIYALHHDAVFAPSFVWI